MKKIHIAIVVLLMSLGAYLFLKQKPKSDPGITNHDIVLPISDLPTKEAEYYGEGVSENTIYKDSVKSNQFFVYCAVFPNDSIKKEFEKGNYYADLHLKKWKRLIKIEGDSVYLFPFVEATKEIKEIKQFNPMLYDEGRSYTVRYVFSKEKESKSNSGKYYIDDIDATPTFFFPNYGITPELPMSDKRTYKGEGIFGGQILPEVFGGGIHLIHYTTKDKFGNGIEKPFYIKVEDKRHILEKSPLLKYIIPFFSVFILFGIISLIARWSLKKESLKTHQ